jgi:hypothetical protein
METFYKGNVYQNLNNKLKGKYVTLINESNEIIAEGEVSDVKPNWQHSRTRITIDNKEYSTDFTHIALKKDEIDPEDLNTLKKFNIFYDPNYNKGGNRKRTSKSRHKLKRTSKSRHKLKRTSKSRQKRRNTKRRY